MSSTISDPDLRIFAKKIPLLTSAKASSGVAGVTKSISSPALVAGGENSNSAIQIQLGVTRISKFYVDWKGDFHGTITSCSKSKVGKSTKHSDIVDVDDVDDDAEFLVEFDSGNGEELMRRLDLKCYLVYHEAIQPLLSAKTSTGMSMDRYGCFGYVYTKNNDTPRMIAEKCNCDVSTILEDEMNHVRYAGSGRTSQLKPNCRFKAGCILRLDLSQCNLDKNDKDGRGESSSMCNEVGNGCGSSSSGTSSIILKRNIGREIPLSSSIHKKNRLNQEKSTLTSSSRSLKDQHSVSPSVDDSADGNRYTNDVRNCVGTRSGAITVHFPRTKITPACTRMIDYSPLPGFEVNSSDTLYKAVSLIRGPWTLVPSYNDGEDGRGDGDRGWDLERIFLIEMAATRNANANASPRKPKREGLMILTKQNAEKITIDDILSDPRRDSPGSHRNLHVWTDVRRSAY